MSEYIPISWIKRKIQEMKDDENNQAAYEFEWLISQWNIEQAERKEE